MHLSLPYPKHVLHNRSLLVYADQALVSGLSFISGILLARYLGISGFGTYGIAWLGVLVASSINQPFIISPMQTLSQKKTTEEKDRYMQALVFNQLFFAFAMAVVGLIAVCVMSWFFNDVDLSSVMVAFPLAVFAFLLQDFFRRYFFLTNHPEKTLLIDAVASGGVLLSAFAIHFIRSIDAQFVLLLTALFYLYATLIAIWGIPQLKFNMTDIKYVLKEHWLFSKWLTATAILQWFSGNLFILSAGAVLGPVAVGVTRMAQNIVGVTHVLFLAMENIIPAKAAAHYQEEGTEGMFRYLSDYTIKAGVITFTLLGCIALFSKEIIEFCYGTSYMRYSYILTGFCALYVIIFLGYPMRYAIRTLEKTNMIFVSFIVSSLFSILCAYPVIHWFGMYGVVLGLMMTQIISLCIYFFFLRHEASDR